MIPLPPFSAPFPAHARVTAREYAPRNHPVAGPEPRRRNPLASPFLPPLVGAAILFAAALFAPVAARAEGPAHGLSMVGSPALPPDFAHLPYANPEAPQGGRLVLAEIGSYDSLHPFIQRGTAPWGVELLTFESLLGRSYDEPFTLYGRLAESVETDEARSHVSFTLREEARFSDGSPVTVEDVIWSFETLGTRGHARFRAAWERVDSIRATGPRSLRVDFTAPDRELPLILGLRPVMQRAQFETGGRDFETASMEPLIGSGPYVVAAAEPGRSVTLRRNRDWWGEGLALTAGLYNLEEVRYDWFGDLAVAFEAFKAGHLGVWREAQAARWADYYDFPAIRDGRIRQVRIPHHRPSGMNGLAMNTRRAPFDDWRVREALILAFDFAQVNRVLNGDDEPRISSYFGNSALAPVPGSPAGPAEAALLAPYALLPGTLEGYQLPDDAAGAARRHRRAALALLAEAGFSPDATGRLHDAAGAPFRFEILLRQGQRDLQIAAEAYTAALARLGIEARVAIVDPAQYVERVNAYDFDMTHMLRLMSLSPGYEQYLYWGSAGREQPGSRNLPGIADPAIDGVIDALVRAPSEAEFTTAARALDRLLMAGRYAIPLWFSPEARLAISQELHYPERLPLYGDWTGFLPETWWVEAPSAQ